MGAHIRRQLTTLLALTLIIVPVLGATATASPSFTEYPIPTSASDPTGITSGPDGNIWFNETLSSVRKIGKITPSGTITEFQVPANGDVSQLNQITSGPDGNLWFTDAFDANSIGRITTSGTITEYSVPTDSSNPWGITAGPDGNLWFTERSGNKIGQITTDGTITEYPIPSSNSGAVRITAGPDGNLWFTETNTNKIGKITTSGTITEYTISGTFLSPYGITAGPDGNLWFTENGTNKIGQITTDGTITEYSMPSGCTNPVDITTGPDNNLWFTGYSNCVGQATTSGTITLYNPPTSHSYPYGITTGSDGNLWFTETEGNQIGKLVLVSAPSAPTNLTATSPTQNPALSWDSVTGATSYNIYRNNSFIDSITTPNDTTYTDFLAPEGTNSYFVTAVNSTGESGHSNTVSILVDRTVPTITYSVSPSPNSSGWNNSPVTITFTCTDNTGGSGIASCSSPITLSADGSNQTATGTATDNAGNTASATATVIIDQTAPTVTNVALATDPLSVNQTTTLSANVADNLSGISKAEYYTGTDPGQGNGTAMSLSNGSATATVGSFATAGMHTYYVRTEDNAGNWSIPMSSTLDVYNPSGGYTAGHGSIVPNGTTSNTNPSDVLPTETGNNLKANFDFTVKYLNSTDTTPTGTSTFTWGSTCNNPHANCLVVTTDTTVNPAIGSLAWLVVPGDNTATFQGTASVNQGSTNLGTSYPVRISVTGTTTTSPGHYLLQVYSVGANPDTASPLYQASGDLSAGSVVLHG